MDFGWVVGIAAGLVLLWALALLIFWVLRPKDVAMREVVGLVPDLVRLLRDLIRDRTVPWDVRVAMVVLVAWIVFPIDLIPEFIPVLGPLDDIVVAFIALRYARRRLGIDEMERRWPGTADGFRILRSVLGG
jgi:uncharacterized membrane protein YkvA (DUF1232 family)